VAEPDSDILVSGITVLITALVVLNAAAAPAD